MLDKVELVNETMSRRYERYCPTLRYIVFGESAWRKLRQMVVRVD